MFAWHYRAGPGDGMLFMILGAVALGTLFVIYVLLTNKKWV